MKKYTLTCIVCFLVNMVLGQVAIKDLMLIDFAVPDQPAFKALGKEPSDLLRPTDIKGIALQLPNFYAENDFIIPLDFGLEIAPWKLYGVGNWNLEDYRNSWLRRFAFNSSISIGAFSGQEVMDIAPEIKGIASIGFRTTLRGKEGDLLRDPDYIRYGQATHAYLQEFTTDWLKKYNKENNTVYDAVEVDADETLQSLRNEAFEDSRTAFDPKSNWNATRLDLALALKGVSTTKSLAGLTNPSFHVWLTKAVKVKNWGQLLLGAHGDYWFNGYDPELSFNDTSGSNFSLSSRFYVGELNRFPSTGLLHLENVKGFIEYEFERNWDYSIQKDLVNIGLEFGVSETLWFNVSGGVEGVLFDYPDFTSRLVGSLDFKWGFLKNS